MEEEGGTGRTKVETLLPSVASNSPGLFTVPSPHLAGEMLSGQVLYLQSVGETFSPRWNVLSPSYLG